MHRYIAGCVAMVWALTACSERAADLVSPDVAQVKAVRIDYQYMGWSSAQESFTLVPADQGSAFILFARARKGVEPHDTGQRVPARAVAVLLAAASAPAWPRERGVRAVASALRHGGVMNIQPSAETSPEGCTPQQLRRLARAYVRRKGLVSLTDDHYGSGSYWTDDYPFLRLEIQLRDGPPLRMHSDSQRVMMLPWYPGAPTDAQSESEQNWSLPLSRALQGVLPSSSSAYERLGIESEWRLRSEIDSAAREECYALRAQSQSSLGEG